MTAVRYVLSIDLESWVHRDGHADASTRRKLDGGWLGSATANLLETLRRFDGRATFFVVAETFDWYPQLIGQIAAGGHEIGYHTHTHAAVTRARLERELELSRRFLEEFGPKGFRAPRMSLPADCLPLLREAGFRYDSSAYAPPGVLDMGNGMVELPVAARRLWGDADVVFPSPLTLRLLLRRIPYGSGYFLGLLGGRIRRFLDREKRSPVVLFLHPWQVGAAPKRWQDFVLHPRSVIMLSYYRDCTGVLEGLLAAYSFSTCWDAIMAAASAQEVAVARSLA